MGSRHDDVPLLRAARRRSTTRLTALAVAVALTTVGALFASVPAGAQATPAEGAPPEASARWLQVDAGFLHTCGITTAHRLYCWGFDGGYALGDGGGRRNRNAPVEVAGHTTDWAQVSAGYDQTCAVKTDHRLFCWGTDTLGLLGNGPGQQDAPAPVEVAGSTTDWAQVSAGGATCAVKTTGRLFCWGQDYRGSLGNGGADTPAEAPAQVSGNATDWQAVSAGLGHVCAMKVDHRIRCFGDDTFGQVGNDEARGSHSTPVAVAGDPTNWATLATSENHTCATTQDDRLFCWGHDHFGQLAAPGQDIADRGTPTEVQRNRTDWGVVSGGGFAHTCATRTSGLLYCWGQTWRAALGRKIPYASQFTPLKVLGFTDWADVTAGLATTCALRTNGLLYCWGNNEFGQAGVGSTARKIVGPTRVALSA